MLAHWVLTWASTGAKWLARLMGSFFLLALIEGGQQKNIEEKNTSSKNLLGGVFKPWVSRHQWLGKVIPLPNVKSNCQLGEWIRGKWSYFINPTLDWGSELSGLGTLDLSYFDSRWLPTAWINSSIVSIQSIQSIHFKQTNQIHPIFLLQIWFELNQTHQPSSHPSFTRICQATKRYKGCESQVRSCGWDFLPPWDFPCRSRTWVYSTHPWISVRKNWTSFRKQGKSCGKFEYIA